ncbi:MAG: tyrosinase family protein [Bacteroidia bacterium]|nr:tyrosinase family protein [Bacteroidia bacterium]
MPNLNAPPKDQAVEYPTWFGHIRHMFTDDDIDHMHRHREHFPGAPDIDLSDYNTVKRQWSRIWASVDEGLMPKDSDAWPEAWVQTFVNWKKNNFKKGIPTVLPIEEDGSSSRRVRKDIETMSESEWLLVIKAFEGMMKKDLDKSPDSYFEQAKIHGEYCEHNNPKYHPWHREYLHGFENAMRKIPGCESVSLPYWDFAKPFPERLQAPLFSNYKFPHDYGGKKAGYKIERKSAKRINKVMEEQVLPYIRRAKAKKNWQAFHGRFDGSLNNTIIQGHDNAHLLMGNTIEDSTVAAFDPMFWFFHCNWDRLWWEWQVETSATSRNGLLSTITKYKSNNPNRLTRSYQAFIDSSEPQHKSLDPFKRTTVETVDLRKTYDTAYELIEPDEFFDEDIFTVAMSASEKVRVESAKAVVRVDGIDRTKIPGSFKIYLLRNDQVIDQRGFFQKNQPVKCHNCVENPLVYFDFELPLELISGATFSFEVEPSNKSFIGSRVPLEMLGEPVMNVNLLITDEF